MPNFSLIAALDQNRLIGRDGTLPWRLPEDLQHFKRLTLGKIVLMGRKTWDSLGRPLPQRDNWVITRQPAFNAPGARLFADLNSAMAAAAEQEVMVIGGAEIYRQTLPLATRLYLTQVHAKLDGDTWFPEFDETEFSELERAEHPADDRHVVPYTFLTLERRR